MPTDSADEPPEFGPPSSVAPTEKSPVRRPADPQCADTYAFAHRWRNESLPTGTSLIQPDVVVWTSANAAELERRIALAPDLSEDTFVGKLAGQLDGANQNTHLLLADLLIVHLLATNNIGLEKKLELIDAVGAMAPEPFTVPDSMHAALRRGPINAGVGFLTNRFWIVSFMIRFAGHWSALDDGERTRLLNDPWAMKALVVDVPGERAQSQRNALLMLLFPDTFEHITSNAHKRRIVEAHAEVAGDDADLDRRLLAARRALEPRFGEGFNWYHSAVRLTWDRVDPVVLPSQDKAWLVRMKRDGAREVIDAIARGDCRIFWSIDAPPGSSLPEIKQALIDDDPDLSTNLLGNHAGQIHRFITKMEQGDHVLVPDGSELYIGRIESDARYDGAEWVRDVTWANGSDPVDRESVSPALYSRLRTLLTVTDISDHAGELVRLAQVAKAPEDSIAEIAPPAYSVSLRRIDTDTAHRLLLDRDWLQGIVELLANKRQLIFYGPPGTGKTFLAEQLAEYLVNDPSNYRIVQFHPSYSYEDFVEGFRPNVDAAGAMTYELKPGPLKQLAEEARAHPNEPYLLIVDEINRGNLAKIFGELYYLLEYRERSIVLQYGTGADDEFSLPKNLYLIGTMNTADRSIALVDAAIRRRFGFVEFSPLKSPVDNMLRTWLRREQRDDRPARLLDELNRLLDDRDLAIGPSYLMTQDSDSDAGLERIWRHEIMPLLDEQFHERSGTAGRFALKSLLETVAPAPQDSTNLDSGASTSDDDIETP